MGHAHRPLAHAHRPLAHAQRPLAHAHRPQDQARHHGINPYGTQALIRHPGSNTGTLRVLVDYGYWLTTGTVCTRGLVRCAQWGRPRVYHGIDHGVYHGIDPGMTLGLTLHYVVPQALFPSLPMVWVYQPVWWVPVIVSVSWMGFRRQEPRVSPENHREACHSP